MPSSAEASAAAVAPATNNKRIYGGRVSADSNMGTADLFVIGEKGEEERGA